MNNNNNNNNKKMGILCSVGPLTEIFIGKEVSFY